STFFDVDLVFARQPAERLHHHVARGVDIFDQPRGGERPVFGQCSPNRPGDFANLTDAGNFRPDCHCTCSSQENSIRPAGQTLRVAQDCGPWPKRPAVPRNYSGSLRKRSSIRTHDGGADDADCAEEQLRGAAQKKGPTGLRDSQSGPLTVKKWLTPV